jgi:hypothetical protein
VPSPLSEAEQLEVQPPAKLPNVVVNFTTPPGTPLLPPSVTFTVIVDGLVPLAAIGVGDAGDALIAVFVAPNASIRRLPPNDPGPEPTVAVKRTGDVESSVKLT